MLGTEWGLKGWVGDAGVVFMKRDGDGRGGEFDPTTDCPKGPPKSQDTDP